MLNYLLKYSEISIMSWIFTSILFIGLLNFLWEQEPHIEKLHCTLLLCLQLSSNLQDKILLKHTLSSQIRHNILHKKQQMKATIKVAAFRSNASSASFKKLPTQLIGDRPNMKATPVIELRSTIQKNIYIYTRRKAFSIHCRSYQQHQRPGENLQRMPLA